MPIVEQWKLGCKLLAGDKPALFSFASIFLGKRIIDPEWSWIWIESSLQHFTVVCCSCERVCVLGMHSHPNLRQKLKSTPFVGTRSHSRRQGELHDSQSSLQTVLTSQPISFPSLLPPGSPHCFSYLQKAEYSPLPAAPHTPAPYACAGKFWLPPSLRNSESLLPVPGKSESGQEKLLSLQAAMILSTTSPAGSVGDRALQTSPKAFLALPSMLIWYLNCSSSKWIISALICLISQNSGGLLTYILGSGGANFHVSVWFPLILRQLHFSFIGRPVLGLRKTNLFLLALFLLLAFCSSFTVILESLPPSVNWQPTERVP